MNTIENDDGNDQNSIQFKHAWRIMKGWWLWKYFWMISGSMRIPQIRLDTDNNTLKIGVS